MNPNDDSAAVPPQPFFSTPQQRLALARQRYFEEGVRPSGLVGEHVIQSWSRCVRQHRDPAERIAFNPVTPSRIHSALTRSAGLLNAAADVLDQLEQTLAGTTCTALLTDAQGVVVHATRSADTSGQLLLPLARRIGVILDEEHIGTGAPGVTLRTGQACRVLGAEHFFNPLQALHCAAAPIRDVHGRTAAVLDVTSELRPFGFDASGIVALYATTIENRLLQAQSNEHLVVRLQTSAALLGTPMEGLAGLDAHGRVVWVNNIGAELLGVARDLSGLQAEQVFGVPTAQISRLTRTQGAREHRLPSGLSIWWSARMQASDGATQLHALGAPCIPAPRPGAGPTLRANDRRLVERTVQDCGGNVSLAARRLGVSRGLVYRHLKRASTL